MVTLNGVKPKNSKEGKIWNRYNNNLSDYEWDWYLIRHWPRNLAQAVISEDLCYMERWQLWLYFVGNGMSPTQGTDMVLDIGSKYFDKAAVAHVQSFNNEHLEANAKKWKYWDEVLGRTRVLGDGLILDKITHGEYKKQWRNSYNNDVDDFYYSGNTKTKQKAEYENIEFYGEEYVKKANEIKASIDKWWYAGMNKNKNNDDDNDDPFSWELERYEGKRP